MRFWSLLLLTCCAFAQSALLDTLTDELNRNFNALKKADPAPYFLSYEAVDEQIHTISASLGAITANSAGHSRTLDTSVRVGSPKLDNYHRMRGDRAQFTTGAALAVDDNPDAIRRIVWMETDRSYRAAAERLIKIRTSREVKVTEEDASDDFSREEPARAREPVVQLKFSADPWLPRLRNLSAGFKQYPAVLTGTVSLLSQYETKYFVNTEGTQLQHGRGFARVVITAHAKAEDGMDLGANRTFEAVEASALPADEVLRAAVDEVGREVMAMVKAPVVDPFVGPAIFSGRAAGVFFHEIFGHRIEGHRQKDEAEGQTFTKSVGLPVLPEFLSVVFDPLRRKAANTDLNGWYLYDDEGVKARPVVSVEKGILKTFLMSRSPIRGFDQSNGHGRRQPGLEIVSRQSNLIVESSRTVPDAKLREMLIDTIKQQKKPYGLYFKEVTGGFTNTGRAGLQAFKVIPLVVYRVYPDGRPDELVRGADIVGTPLASFAKILATSDRSEVFNGYCGAESGSVPVSAVSPALLVSEIEIEKRQKSQERPPLLPPPPDTEKRS